MKKIDCIAFSALESVPDLVKDFLTEDLEWFDGVRFGEDNFERKIREREGFSPERRRVLVEVLREQSADLQLTDKQRFNLDALLDEKTFTVVTGHQLNLYMGPSFFVYKILQTIKTAEYLREKFPGIQVVPVFWMASEDHDFEEINHFKTKDGFYEFRASSGGAVGRLKVEDTAFVSRFEESFSDRLFGAELIRWMREAYREGASLSQATRVLVQRLFSAYGLLVLDGDDSRLKAQMKPFFRKELLEQVLYETTAKRIGFLKERYGRVQVNPRAVNLFYLTATRDRIERQGEEYVVVDKNLRFTRTAILEELEKHPERFSPNALMRPVYQEVVLPNLAYIGGNAEVMYWLELQDYFAENNLSYPVLIPRNSVVCLDEKELRKAEKLGLLPRDFFGNFAEVVRGAMLKDVALEGVLRDSRLQVEQVFEVLKSRSVETDVTFGHLVAAEQARQLKSYERMHKRLVRAEKRKQAEKLERLETLFLRIHPGGVWQERVFNFSVFYADYGRLWIEECYEKMNVDKSELLILGI
ncbi:bacillithiol biosynthesis cysteine-adding enzyme BshC [Bergeyella sp. RCAD1439]|uniref:bacillithiol biosynthesis cysteine-adding enzyme BshC n=1 Tax=Bergeyella anatis TaxID=3113737 RepID=UPI002E1914B2|nr:bacillithiol biosynthesis cysteine-adding enzyme BshC [Bergeyella sp. RCAD1439]